MGAKEDQVRHRLAREDRERQEKERIRQEKIAARKSAEAKEFDELMKSFDEEAARIAAILEQADWSQARLVKFRIAKRHWWQRGKLIEMALLRFATNHHLAISFGMRSDGVLFVGWNNTARHDYMIPRKFFRSELPSYIKAALEDLKASNVLESAP